ncbi:MAG: hypothetical protein H6Q52_1105 [Deltaproteobacteria bacterium]|nr:hypothetical protein [Deltaproteobacteria bacterium]
MKRYLMFAFAVIMGLSLVTVSFAQTPAAPKAAPAKPAVTEKAAPAAPATPAPAPEKKAEKKATKEKVHQATGEVTAVDMAAKTLTIKAKKGDMTFDVTDVKMKAEPKAGDKVMVKYTEKDGKMTAKSVKAVKAAKKAEKKEAKPAAEKPATEKPAAPVKAPAAAPAPAPAK